MTTGTEHIVRVEHGSASHDLTRQLVVAVTCALAIIGSAIGSGAFGGTQIADAAGGALSAHATLIAPAVPAFSIWSVIYLGLVAYAVWQFLPAQKTSLRQRQLGYPIAASLVLNAAWILSVQAGLLWLSVVVIVVLLAVLGLAFRTVVMTRSSGWVETVIVDGTVGLYLGWVCVATAANIASALVAARFNGFGIAPGVWAVVVLLVAAVVGILLAAFGRGRFAPSAAIVWGIAWIAVARLNGTPHSVLVGVSAIVAAALVVAATLVFRRRKVA